MPLALRPAPAVRRLRRTVLLHRRGLAALLAALSVLAGVRAATEPPPTLHPVLVAARDLPGGTAVEASDVRLAELPAGAVPRGATSAADGVVGRVLAAPLRSGEPVTDVRLVAPGLADGYPGTVLAPVRIADAGAVGLLRVGDLVDVVATSPETGRAAVVARSAPVVALPTGRRSGGAGDLETAGLTSGGLVVLAVDDATALALGEGAVASVLSMVLTGDR